MKKFSFLASVVIVALILNLTGIAFVLSGTDREVNAEALSVTYDFSQGNPDGPLAVGNLTHTNNGTNNLFIGGQSGYNNIGTPMTPGYLMFRTLNVSDFAVTINESNSPENNAVMTVKAYISSESNAGFTEITLNKALNPTQPTGWKSYIYTVNAVSDIITDTSYVKIEVMGVNGQIQIMGFKYFYSEAVDINAGYQFISYDFTNGNPAGPVVVTDLVCANNVPNAAWLGGVTGYNNLTHTTGSMVFKTDKLYNFKAIVNTGNMATLQVKAYVSASSDSGFTEVVLKSDLNAVQPTGWKSQIFSLKNVTALPAGSGYVKIEVTGDPYGLEIMGFTYYYGNKGDEPNYEPEAINGGYQNTIYDFANGSPAGPVSNSSFLFASNGSNAEYIGAVSAYVYSGSGTANLIFKTDDLFNFDFTLNAGDQTGMTVRAFVSSLPDSGYTEIVLKRGMNLTQPTGWKSYIYSPKNPESNPAGMKYVKLEVTGVNLQVQIIGFRYFYNDTAVAPDLAVNSKLIDFSAGDTNGVILKNNFNITMNSVENTPFLGGQYGYVFLASKSGDVKFFAGNVRDFVSTINMPNIKNVDVKAYISASKDTGFTEIQLTKQLNPTQPTGWKSYQFRPKNRDLIPAGTMYVKLVVAGEPYMLQMMGFKFFFEGDEIAPPPPDNPLGNGSVITDITKANDIKTYNFIANNMNYTRIDNMFITHNSQGNIDYIGTETGLFMSGEGTGSIVFRTMGIKNFWIRINYFDSSKDLVKVKISVAPSDDDSLYQEIDSTRFLSAKQPTGMKSYIYTSTPDAVFPLEDMNYIKIEIDPAGAGYATFQMVGLDYKFITPMIASLPEMAQPGAGELALLDDMTTVGVIDDGGLMNEILQMDWKMTGLGGTNGTDKVVVKEDYIADGYIVYKYNGMNSFDVRGYKHPECQQDMEFYTSPDNENWTKVENVDLFKSPLLDGPVQVSYQKKSLPRGTNYLKILIPELEGQVLDLSISDVQIIYSNVYYNPGTSDSGMLPALALLLSSAVGITLLKKRGKKHENGI